MRVARLLAPALGLVLLTSGCGSSGGDPNSPVFDNQAGKDIACMQHQPAAPGPRYSDPAKRDTAQVLTMLRYYAVNGHKPYCDGKPAGPTDVAWAQLFVQLGADRTAVAPLLAGH